MAGEIDLSGFDIGGAERIAIPKGADRGPCVDALQEVADIEVPTFGEREYSAESEGREFFLIKGGDIPGLVRAGVVDLGATGTDSYESLPGKETVLCEPIGESMCQLVLMAQEQEREWAELLISGEGGAADGEPAPVFTPLPVMLDDFAEANGLPIRAMRLPEGVKVSGSVEIVPKLLRRMGVDLVADRVSTGRTAAANGLVQIMGMTEIHPALVQRADATAGELAEVAATPAMIEV